MGKVLAYIFLAASWPICFVFEAACGTWRALGFDGAEERRRMAMEPEQLRQHLKRGRK